LWALSENGFAVGHRAGQLLRKSERQEGQGWQPQRKLGQNLH